MNVGHEKYVSLFKKSVSRYMMSHNLNLSDISKQAGHKGFVFIVTDIRFNKIIGIA